MKNVRAGWMMVCGMFLAACGDAVAPPTQLSEVSASEELVSETQVVEATDMTDRADFSTDVPNRDRVCQISDRTIVAAKGMVESAALVGRYLDANYARTHSAANAAAFTRLSEALYTSVQGPSSCWQIARDFAAMARAGRALGASVHEEGLIRRDDRLGRLLREARVQFSVLLEHLRHDLRNQANDRVTDRPVSARP